MNIKYCCYIYLLLDMGTMKGYVGKSILPEARAKTHWDMRFKMNFYIHRWLCKLSSPPQLIILDKGTQKNWQEKEKGWIRDLRLGGLALANMAIGGESANEGRSLSESHKKKIGLAHIGHKVSEETREKIRRSLTGRKHTEERKHNQRMAHLGNVVSQQTRRKISKTMRNYFKEIK